MGKFKVGDVVIIKNCEYANSHNVVGLKAEITSLEAGEFDYKAKYLNHPNFTHFEDLLNEDEIVLFVDKSKNYTETNTVSITYDYKVIYNDPATIVIFKDGSKGVAKCAEGDTYNKETGLKIAFGRAAIKSMNKKVKELYK